MIEIDRVTKKYGDYIAIDGMSCRISSGDDSGGSGGGSGGGDSGGGICGLAGPNGAGKTTLLKCVCGILKPDRGNITIDGQPVYDNEYVKNRVFFVPDDPYMLPQSSMAGMARFYRGHYSNWDNTIFDRLTGIFGLDAKQKLGSFSRGMRKQAFLAYALSVCADYLLLDEALDGLDPEKRGLAWQLLARAAKERGACVVLASHDLRELGAMCDQTILMK